MSPGTVRGNASGDPRRCGGVDEAGGHSGRLSVVRLEECPTERKKSRRAEPGVLRNVPGLTRMPAEQPKDGGSERSFPGWRSSADLREHRKSSDEARSPLRGCGSRP